MSADVYIIKGNPEVDKANAGHYEKLYDDIAKIVGENGFTSEFDQGLDKTVPPGGKLWIGHSRGGDRLRFAPDNISTLRLDDFEPADYKAKQQVEYDKIMKEHKVNTVADLPIEARPTPGKEHYMLSDEAMTALISKLKELRKKKNE